MRIHVVDTQDAAAILAAGLVVGALVRDPAPVLGLATGATMDGVYRELLAGTTVAVRRAWRSVQAFALDEYVGLPAGHEASFRVGLRSVTERLGVPDSALHVPEGWRPDPEAAAADYESTLQSGGPVHLQLLGLGTNGHIGFNEPGSPFTSRTHVVELSDSTRADNARFFRSGSVPERAITQGIATILSAQSIVMLAFGATKAAAVAGMIDGPVGPDLPASALRGHTDVTVILDRDSAAALT